MKQHPLQTTVTALDITELTDNAPDLTVFEGIAEGDTAVLQLGSNTTRETQYLIEYSGTLASEEQLRPVAVAAVYSGGISGSATIASLADAGTMVSLAMANQGEDAIEPVDVVIGGGSQVDLPDFVISGIFPNDVGTSDGNEGDSDTITVTPADGVIISGNPVATCAAGTGTVRADIARNVAIARDVLTLTITANCGDADAAPMVSDAITVEGLTATLAPDAGAGPFALTLTGTADTFTDGIAVDVAQGVESGEVTVTRASEMPARVGPGTIGTVDVLLTESTYGSLRVGTPPTYIIVIPSDNVLLTGVGVSTIDPPARLPQIDNGRRTIPNDGSYVLTVTEESTSLEEDDAVRLTISYTVNVDAAIGGTVSFSIEGTAGVSANIEAAEVTINTVSSAMDSIPAVTASTNAVSVARLKIDGAIC